MYENSKKKWTQEEIDICKELYKNYSVSYISEVLNRSPQSINVKLNKIGIKKPRKECSNYFDSIDNKCKAYWIGFIWSDGYVWVRNRSKKEGTFTKEYGFKLDLCDVDESHLYKLKDNMKIKTSIKNYSNYKNTFSSKNGVSRISCYDKHLVLTMQEKYGIIPNRNDANKLINNIPKEYYKDFIRGVMDADGSFSKYVSHNSKRNNDEIKYNITLGGTETLLRFMEKVLVKQGLLLNMTTERKLQKRHKDKDGNFLSIKISGKNNFYNILNWLYEDANIYLDRKYDKFINYKKEDFN